MVDDDFIEPPSVFVRDLLWEVIAHADQQLADELGDEDLEASLRALASELLDGQSELFVKRFSRGEHLLERRQELLDIPWFRFVLELELAHRAIRRVDEARIDTSP